METGCCSDVAFPSNYLVHKASKEGDVQSISLFLESNPNLTVLEDPFKFWTPIHWAAYFGKLDCIRQIVCADPRVINIQSSKSFQTAMHCTAEAGHPHCLLWLLQSGANSEVKDYMGETALHKAARMGNAECVSLLVATSCNVSCLNSMGQTASIVADICGYPAIGSFIRKHEFGINTLRPSLSNGGIVPQIVRFSRKRSYDVMSSDSLKRLRTNDFGVQSIPLPETMNNFMHNKTTSVVEHERLCRVETGYTNSLFDCILSEFHGC